MEEQLRLDRVLMTKNGIHLHYLTKGIAFIVLPCRRFLTLVELCLLAREKLMEIINIQSDPVMLITRVDVESRLLLNVPVIRCLMLKTKDVKLEEHVLREIPVLRDEKTKISFISAIISLNVR